MSNHLHVVLKTPEPNLSRGMQSFLSGYANAWSRRHRFSGHVFQGRYRTELVEDETYLSGAKHSSNASKQWCAANRAANGAGNHNYCRVYPSHESLSEH